MLFLATITVCDFLIQLDLYQLQAIAGESMRLRMSSRDSTPKVIQTSLGSYMRGTIVRGISKETLEVMVKVLDCHSTNGDESDFCLGTEQWIQITPEVANARTMLTLESFTITKFPRLLFAGTL